MFFERKQIAAEETVGSQLRQAREQKNLSLEKAANRLNIKRDYLAALEQDDIKRLPTGVYARNFLREYARLLGLDARSLVEQFAKTEHRIEEPAPFERQIVAKRYLVAVPVLVRNVIIAVVALICLVYLGFLVDKIFQAPFLTLEYPGLDTSVQDRRLEVRGLTAPETDVTINGQTVQVSVEGRFIKELYLEQGLNTITVVAKKKYSRPASVVRYVLFETPPTPFN